VLANVYWHISVSLLAYYIHSVSQKDRDTGLSRNYIVA